MYWRPEPIDWESRTQADLAEYRAALFFGLVVFLGIALGCFAYVLEKLL